jgi:hypothetical protein
MAQSLALGQTPAAPPSSALPSLDMSVPASFAFLVLGLA